MFLQLDSLYYTPDINLNAGARPGATAAFHFLEWTPQLLWALAAAWLLVKRVKAVQKAETPWPALLVPYVMVLLVIAFWWNLYGVKIGSIHQYQQGIGRAMFKDSALPSLWAIPCLLLVHLVRWLDGKSEKNRK
jgi:hypothetical protein